MNPQHSHVYMAPPGFHLQVEDGRMRLRGGPTENHHRPAIDPLFRSAAHWYGPATVGIVLSGYLDDGSAGLFRIKQAGGVAIVLIERLHRNREHASRLAEKCTRAGRNGDEQKIKQSA